MTTKGKSRLDPKEYKPDALVQVWLDRRKLALLSKWIDSDGGYNGRQTKWLSEVVRFTLDMVVEMLTNEGWELEGVAESSQLLERKYGIKPGGLNPGGKGGKNKLNNLLLDDRRGESLTMTGIKNSSNWWNNVGKDTGGSNSRNIELPSDEEIEETIKVVAITDTLIAAGVRIPELSKRERESMRIAVMTDRMEIFFSEVLGFGKEDSSRMASETRERIKASIDHWKATAGGKAADTSASTDLSADNASTLQAEPSGSAIPVEATSSESGVLQAESLDSAFPAEELNPTFQAKHLDSSSKAVNSAPMPTADDNISIIREGMTEEEANKRQAEKDKKYEAELRAAMEAMRAKAR
jgi:hypothetical protein